MLYGGQAVSAMSKEFGRCVSKMYCEHADRSSTQVGYVFEKRVEYTDTNDTFLQQAWVEVLTRDDVIEHKRFYYPFTP